MTAVRIAEFAWSRLEPEPGRFDLDWLERAVTMAAEYGISAAIGTPTAAPPAWLTQRHPEVLAIRDADRPEQHGSRCHYSPASVTYREYCASIASALAQRFGRNKNVIGWQIDNEYWSWSFDHEAMQRFQGWLKNRYGTLKALNQAWSNAYWSEEYFDWSQVPRPVAGQNPCLIMAWRQFMTDIYIEYQSIQIEAIRKHADTRQWITHNIHAHERLDWTRIAQDLDFAAYDPYIGSGHLNHTRFGFMIDACRGFKRAPFWIIETQPASVNWSSLNNTLDKGETRRLAWHCAGHGAEAVLWWQWRAALGGQEQYHGCLVAPDGTPRPFYREAAQVGREFAAASNALEGTEVETDVALLWSYPDRWALMDQRHHRDFDPLRHWSDWYGGLREAGTDVDVLNPLDDLTHYRLVVAPSQHIMTPAIVHNLVRYVEQGGVLVLGPRSGFKDEHNALLPSRQPGQGLREALGASVAEFYALETPVAMTGAIGPGRAEIWAEYLSIESPDVRVLLSYGTSNGWLDGQPGVVTRTYGNGQLAYVGAWPDKPTLRAILDWALQKALVRAPLGRPPENVEICRRVKDDREVFVVINHGQTPATLSIPHPMRAVLTSQVFTGSIPLPANDVLILSP